MCARNCEVMRSQHCNHLITFFSVSEWQTKKEKLKEADQMLRLFPVFTSDLVTHDQAFYPIAVLIWPIFWSFKNWRQHWTSRSACFIITSQWMHWNQLKFRHVRPIYSSLVTFSKRSHFTQNWSIIFDDFFIIFYSFYCAQFHIYRFINGRTKINIRQ